MKRRASVQNRQAPKVHPRIVERGAAIKRYQTRRIVILATSLTTIIVFIWLLVAFVNSSFFAISSFRITVKGHDLKTSLVDNITKEYKAANYFQVSTISIRNALMKDPLVSNATVSLIFPNAIVIDVVEARVRYVVMLKSSPRELANLGSRNQLLPKSDSSRGLAPICMTVNNFVDKQAEFACAPFANIGMYLPNLSRVSAIERGLKNHQIAVVDVYIFSGFGIGVLDSFGRYIYFSDQNSIASAVADLLRLPLNTTGRTPMIVDLSVTGHPVVS